MGLFISKDQGLIEYGIFTAKGQLVEQNFYDREYALQVLNADYAYDGHYVEAIWVKYMALKKRKGL